MRSFLVRGLWLCAALSVPRGAWAQPNLGHKIPGAVGLDAGTQPEAGVYVASRFLYYDAIRVRDRDGARVPIPGFDIDGYAYAFGVAGTVELESGLLLSFAAAAPVARLSIASGDPRAEVDRFGLGDVFVKPLQLGRRWPRADLLASYAFYAPTRQINRAGLGSPQWSHQLSVGTTLYLDENRRGRISALFSYDLHQRKLDVDVTRGDIVQLQGGVGTTLRKVVEVGIAGYALWQVTDDRGADLPAPLRGRRDRVFGLGPELNVIIPRTRAKLGIRYLRDFGVQGRPEGQIVVVSLSVLAWSPS